MIQFINCDAFADYDVFHRCSGSQTYSYKFSLLR